MAMIQWVLVHKAELLGGLLALSEALAYIPQVKANSVFQLVVNGLLKLSGK